MEYSSTARAVADCSTTPVRVTVVSESWVKPVFISEDSVKPHYLTPWDIPGLNYEHMKFGLLFDKPGDDHPMHIVLDRLKNSLATTLTHFVPFSGRFVTQLIQHPPSYSVYVDCKDPLGAGFIHTVASDVSISDILTPTYVPQDIMKSLFALPLGTLNAQGHTLPLLVVQVNELVDGIFIGFTANHALADGTSFWHFVNFYSEVCRSNAQEFVISRPPVMSPWFSGDQLRFPGCPPSPGTGGGFTTPSHTTCKQRVFHFTSGALTHIKMKANNEYGTNKISTFQALSALIWRALTRARGLQGDQLTTCAIPVNCRSRLEPPLSDVYFGNGFIPEYVTTTAAELLINNLGWAVSKLHDRLINCANDRVHSHLEQFSTGDYTLPKDTSFVIFGNSPRFDIYGNNFGWGKPLAMRVSGHVMDGVVNAVSGRDKGSIDLIINLFSEYMDGLEADGEFMGALSSRKL